MDIMNLLFSFKGRIRRMHFWLGFLGICIVEGIIISVVNMVLHPTVDATTGLVAMNPIANIVDIVVYLGTLYMAFAIYWKRMHDTDRSGWWSLVPIFNIIVAGFFAGTTGENKYGPDPKGGVAAPAAS